MPAKRGQSSSFVVADGIRFYKSKSGYYKSAKGVWMHRYIWERENGAVPDNCDIHHKDGNRGNNVIDNLECVPRQRHHVEHMEGRDKAELSHILGGAARPAATEWHKSSKGREWHREQYERTLAPKLEETVTLSCEYCGKPFVTKKMLIHKTRFCSNNCKTQARRVSRVDNEERICSICGKPFSANRYTKTKTCSRACSVESMRRAKSRHTPPV